jgi:hydrogenase expression/formation protein HypD
MAADVYRDPGLTETLARALHREVTDRPYRFMEFCGGHTHALSRHGLEDVLPPQIEMIHGPGCPVCVLPIGRLDMAIRLVQAHDVTLCVYGDMLRVPGSGSMSLMKAKAQGGDVRMIYSPMQAVALARSRPDRQVVFFAVGFETTTPPTAVAMLAARAQGLANFSVFCNHVLTPAAIRAIMECGSVPDLDGFVGPGHVSTIIGTDAYAPAAAAYRKPIAIAGFEPVDLLDSILRLVRQTNAGTAEVENGYERACPTAANRHAMGMIAKTMAVRDDFGWRGLGRIADSALRLNSDFSDMDAELRFDMVERDVDDHKACECAAILRGEKRPVQCKVFANGCTPDSPLGACMVSPEGACAAHYLYGRFRSAIESVA